MKGSNILGFDHATSPIYFGAKLVNEKTRAIKKVKQGLPGINITLDINLTHGNNS